MNESIAGYPIKVVSEMTGVPLHTLRAWERRYGVPRPKRQPANRYRLYDQHDISDVLWMKKQVESGMPPGQAGLLLRQLHQERLPTEPSQALEHPLSRLQAFFLQALLLPDEARAGALLNEAFALFPPEQVVGEMVHPVMIEIGNRWHQNLITPWQEHLASNLIRQKILAILQAQTEPTLEHRRLLAACGPEEQHELGLLFVALVARRMGWHVTYLGQRTPLEDIYRYEGNPLVVISVTTVAGLASLIPLWDEGKRITGGLVFGGEIFDRVPRLREQMPGAVLDQDLLSAVRSLEKVQPRTTWRPPQVSLAAAVALQDVRLELAARAIDRLMTQLRRAQEHGTSLRSQTLSGPTLFLVDALSSALAFDAPELMQVEGEWVRELLTVRGVGLDLLARHVAAFGHVVSQLLPREASVLTQPLLESLLTAAKSQVH